MKNMKISVKLLVGFLIVTAFSVVLAGIGIFSGIYINDNYSYLLDEPIERESSLKEAQLQFTMMRYRAANFVMEIENPDIINNTLKPQYQAAYLSLHESINEYIYSLARTTVGWIR